MAVTPDPPWTGRGEEARDGRAIRYESLGDGPPLILVHGSLQDHRAWRGVAVRVGHVRRVIAYDRAGYGSSDPRPVGADALATDVHDLVTLLHALPEPAAVVASSYGALVGLLAAARAPDRVDVLVLHEPPTRPDDRYASILPALDGPDPRSGVVRFLDRIGVELDERRLGIAVGWAPLLVGEMRSVADVDPAEVSRPRVRIAVAIGSWSPSLVASSALEWLARLAPAQRVDLPDAGHDAMIARPDLFASALLPLLVRETTGSWSGREVVA